MRVENGLLILEENSQDCHWCSYQLPKVPRGMVAGRKWIKCPKCNGTGRRGSGRCRECKPLSLYGDSTPGFIEKPDPDNPVTCPHCNGDWQGFEDDKMSDRVPSHLLELLELKVIRMLNRQQSWQEQHLGGLLGSCIDYGRHKHQTDEELIAYEKRMFSPQAYGLVDQEMRFAKGVAIITAENGYTKKAYFE